ncbi:MAG: AbrB/MazE/SpoVT family DNA-binding domain-containing protein [Patescibacteria group bacterium]|nr:AbrB/MazE/SpoVT family DNA-binding domain-containing protein [Patescibacteria group bacterium]
MTTTTQTLNEIVRPMERGQITIPVAIRKKLKITPKTWLWVRLIKNKILIEPVEKKSSLGSLSNYLLSSVSDQQTYWRKEDTKALTKIKKKSKERLKKLI